MAQPTITVTVQNDITSYLVRGWRCKINGSITSTHTSVTWLLGKQDGRYIRWNYTISINDSFTYSLIGDTSIYIGCQINGYSQSYTDMDNPNENENYVSIKCYTAPTISSTTIDPESGNINQTLNLNCVANGAYGYEWYVSRGSGSTTYKVLNSETITETGALTITLGETYDRWWVNVPALYYFWCRVYGYKDGENYTSWVESTPKLGYVATYAPPEYDSVEVSPTNGIPSSGASLTFTVTTYDTTVTSYEWQQYISNTWTTIGTTTSSSFSKVIDTSTIGVYQFRCIMHNTGSATTTTSTVEYRVYEEGTFVCVLDFLKYSELFPESVHKYYNIIDFVHKTDEQKADVNIIKGGFKWSRTTNKNAIYVQLPVEVLDEGGYGYDLGFLQDNFTLEYSTNDYYEYLRFMSLVKTNTGERVGVLRLGYAGAVEEYNVIIRYVNASGEPGTEMISISCTLTVTTKKYAAQG